MIEPTDEMVEAALMAWDADWQSPQRDPDLIRECIAAALAIVERRHQDELYEARHGQLCPRCSVELDRECIAEGSRHHYLSTGCLHGEHDYCSGSTGVAGSKKPAACKFCSAPCVCGCHQEACRA